MTSSERTWQGYGSETVNICTNELAIAPDKDDERHQWYLDAVPFAVANWHTEPWQQWSEAPGHNKESWMPFLTDFLATRSADTKAGVHSSGPATGRSAYSPMERPNTIRILELMPAPSDGEMHGTLHEVDVEFAWPEVESILGVLRFTNDTIAVKATKVTNFAISLLSGRPICYTALSYFWGPPKFDKTIAISGVVKSITTALHDALVHLRHTERSVMLWVDQICIDQDNLADKEAQIKLMGTIYSRAWNTVIWIPTGSDRGAFKALEGMYEVLRYRNDNRLFDHEISDLLHPPAGEDEDALRNLKEVLGQPWFQRTWVIQEACLSHEPFVMTGHTAIPWVDFSLWCRIVANVANIDREQDIIQSGQKDSMERPSTEGLQVAAQLYLLREASDKGRQRQLIDTLVDTRYAQVTKSLDKVYGVLGLCGSAIKPDYSKSLQALYHEVAVEIVQGAIDDPTSRNNCFRLLCSVDHEPTNGLPSWAVDWSRPRVTTSLGLDAFLRGYFDAGGGGAAATTGTLEVTYVLSIDTTTLTLSGKVIGTIQRVSESCASADLSADDCKTRNRSLQEAIVFANSGIDKPAKNLFSTLCETMVAGKDGYENVRCPDNFIEIFSLLCDETTGKHPSVPDQIYSKRQQQGYFTTANLKTRTAGRALQSLRRAYKAAMLNRRLCWTDNGYLGLVPRHTHAGDLLCVLIGSVVPFVVRKRPDGDYTLIGECYVHDVMQGQLLGDERVPVEKIILS